MLKLDETGLTFDGAIRLADADRHTRITLNRERCVELLFTAYDCGRHGNAPLPNGVISTITRAVANWNTGERHLRQEARVAINQIELPEPARTSAAYLDRMAKVQEKFGLCAAEKVTKYSEDQPRQPAGAPDSAGGQFAPEDDDSDSDDIPTKKANFVGKYLDDSQYIANRLQTPVANILALAAIEGGWGKSPFAQDGNNFFGLHAPARYSDDYMEADDDPSVHVAAFPDYATGLKSFYCNYGHFVQGVSDPKEFAQKLQDSWAFGIKSTSKMIDGKKKTVYSKKLTYASDVGATSQGLQSYIDKERGMSEPVYQAARQAAGYNDTDTDPDFCKEK